MGERFSLIRVDITPSGFEVVCKEEGLPPLRLDITDVNEKDAAIISSALELLVVIYAVKHKTLEDRLVSQAAVEATVRAKTELFEIESKVSLLREDAFLTEQRKAEAEAAERKCLARVAEVEGMIRDRREQLQTFADREAAEKIERLSLATADHERQAVAAKEQAKAANEALQAKHEELGALKAAVAEKRQELQILKTVAGT